MCKEEHRTNKKNTRHFVSKKTDITTHKETGFHSFNRPFTTETEKCALEFCKRIHSPKKSNDVVQCIFKINLTWYVEFSGGKALNSHI